MSIGPSSRGLSWRARAALFALAQALLACPASDDTAVAPPDTAARSATPPSQPLPPRTPPRLILLVSLDTLRADHLGLYGHERFTSPILDAFGAQGVVFDDVSTTAPWTLPAHASLLTGRFPASHGVVSVRTPLPERVPTLASLLARAGYATAAVVNSTWLKQEEFGLTRGFERFAYVEEDPARRAPSRPVTDQALEWLGNLGTRPLFLFVHYFDVHSDYASEPAYERLFVSPYGGIADGTAWQLTRANLEDEYLAMCREKFDPARCTFAGRSGNNVIDRSVSRMRFDADDVRHLEELYDAGVRQLDTELGRLFAFLDEQGLAQDSVVIVTSDHGEEFMEHGRVDHFLTTYQEVLHVPLVIRGPGIPAGVRIREPVSLVDVVPTVLGIAGVAAPPDVEGSDLSGLWRGGAPAGLGDRLLFAEASGGLTFELVLGEKYFPIYTSVRQGRFKLVHDTSSDHYALFDLAEDPGERVDVASAQPDVAARLTEVLRARHACPTCDEASGPGVELPEEDAARLRALGYLP